MATTSIYAGDKRGLCSGGKLDFGWATVEVCLQWIGRMGRERLLGVAPSATSIRDGGGR